MGRLREGVGWFSFLLFLPDMDRTGSKRETWDQNIRTKQNTLGESPQTMELGHGGRLDVQQQHERLISIIFKWHINATLTSLQLLKTCPRSTSLTHGFFATHTRNNHFNSTGNICIFLLICNFKKYITHINTSVSQPLSCFFVIADIR